MSGLSELSIRRPVFAWMLMAACLVFGFLSYRQLGISSLPDVDFPVVSVSLTLNGAAPEVMESQVLDPIEDAIMQIDGVRSVTSTALQSSATIAVEFELDRNIDQALEDVQNRINRVQNLLPIGLFPPTLRKSNPEDQPILWLVLTSKDPSTKISDMMIYARNTLYDEFGVVPGVGNIFLGGYVDPALRVWIDPKRLAHYDLTADDVVQTIQSEHQEVPAGTFSSGDKAYNLRYLGEAADPQAFGALRVITRVIEGPNYRPTRLDQVAKIEEGIADVRKISRFNGVRAIGLGIVKQHGANAVQVADLVRKRLAEIRPQIPARFDLAVRTDNTVFIKQSVDDLVFTLILSALLTSLVCYLFLGSWTSTLNVLLAIPTSIVGTFAVIRFCGFTLNTFTLLALALAVGIVVDDAIMMLENIVRHRERGEDMVEAAINGSREITFASIAATAAVVAIFLPVVFMKGVIGRYFLQYGVTVTAAVLLSLLEALTLTPMRCSRYLRAGPEARQHGLAHLSDVAFHGLARVYEAALVFCLRHRWSVLMLTALIFAASLVVAHHLPSEMMPEQDQSMMLMRIKLPVGSSIERTSDVMDQVDAFLKKRPEVDGTYSAVGGFGGDAVNQAMAFVMLVDRSQRKLSQAQLIRDFRAELIRMLPGIEVVVQDLSLRGFAATRGFPVEFVVQGPDWNTLTSVTGKIMDTMKAQGFATDVNTDVQAGMPELQIRPVRAKLAEHGVALSTVTGDLNALVGGQILTGTTEYTKAGHRYEIEVRLSPEARDEAPELNRIQLRNNRGQTVPLAELVERKIQPSLMLISRLNRSRAITVYANAAPGHSQDEALKRTEEIAHSILPPGYKLKMIGSSQSYQESFQSLILALALGVLVSYMVLASQFNSFIDPVVVLLALPFSFTGAFLGLRLFHQTINMYSLIGFILLMGIVKKNSILLVDFTNRLRREGKDVDGALLGACPVRLRPILMTSVATVAAALPAALAIGPGAEARAPMAVAIIGGVSVSTVLTLFVVPCAYSLVSRDRHTAPALPAEPTRAAAA